MNLREEMIDKLSAEGTNFKQYIARMAVVLFDKLAEDGYPWADPSEDCWEGAMAMAVYRFNHYADKKLIEDWLGPKLYKLIEPLLKKA